MEANTIQATITDTATVKALSNGISDTTKQNDLPHLRRMLNEGQNEDENEDEGEEEMGMESSSEINIEAHEGMYRHSFKAYFVFVFH